MIKINEGKSAAIFCYQVAALVPDIFCDFYIMKNHKIVKNSAITKARGKISTNFESSQFYNFLMFVELILKQSNFTE